MNNIVLSICVIVYNHEKYLREALDSFLNQNFEYGYEIIIHDDVSTDKSREIILEYSNKYPNVIIPFFESENIYSKGMKIIPLFSEKIRGKYVAFCEGDDFWNDKNKIARQVEMLQHNTDYVACVHNTIILNCKDNSETLMNLTDCKETVFDVERIIKWDRQYSFHLSSLVVRSEVLCDFPQFYYDAPVGDYSLSLYIATRGRIVFLPYNMSVYRKFTANGWTTTHATDYKKQISMLEKLILMLQQFNEYTGGCYYSSINNQVKHYNNLIISYKFSSRDYKLKLSEMLRLIKYKVIGKIKI